MELSSALYTASSEHLTDSCDGGSTEEIKPSVNSVVSYTARNLRSDLYTSNLLSVWW